MIAMEATIFTGWIYNHLFPHAEKVKVAHPLMLRAIAAAKRKNDKIDARKIADCLRCDLLPERHMASTEIRDRRRTLRYRNLVLRQAVQMKNRVSGLLMVTGVSCNKLRLHRMGYFAELMSTNEEVSESIRPLLRLCREHIDRSIRVRLFEISCALILRYSESWLIGEVVEHSTWVISNYRKTGLIRLDGAS
jgi:transposase